MTPIIPDAPIDITKDTSISVVLIKNRTNYFL